MIKTKKTGDLIVISGPSGTGKDTIREQVLKKRKQIAFSISMTTRPMRDKEKEGKDYYFVTKEEFEEKIESGDLLEYAIVHQKDYYGTPKEQVLKTLQQGIDMILVIDIQGALQIKEKYPEAVFIFILPPSVKELKKRLVKRGSETKESLLRRFKSMYKEINEIAKYNYVVINDELKEAVNKTLAIMDAQKCRVDRIEELDINSIEEAMHEDLVDFSDTKNT